MNRKTKIALITAGAATVLAAGAGVAVASGVADDDGDSRPITGPALQRAGDAALAHVGSGKVTATEVGDEDGFYEVEVTKDDGTEVDVALAEDFTVIGDETDAPGQTEDDAGDR